MCIPVIFVKVLLHIASCSLAGQRMSNVAVFTIIPFNVVISLAVVGIPSNDWNNVLHWFWLALIMCSNGCKIQSNCMSLWIKCCLQQSMVGSVFINKGTKFLPLMFVSVILIMSIIPLCIVDCSMCCNFLLYFIKIIITRVHYIVAWSSNKRFVSKFTRIPTPSIQNYVHYLKLW